VHKWRASVEAILVGGETIRADNPMLNVREWSGKDPLRIVLSGSGSIPAESAFFRTNGTNLVFTANRQANFSGAKTICLPANRSAASHIAGYLYRKGIGSLLIEGGAKVLSQFIDEGLWDEARVFYGKMNLERGVEAPKINGIQKNEISFNTSLLKVYYNTQS
jgi:diaminohydroxyphosphoribosylaminopyrimidine deaminase/5-amino-6-(5-phosphoribosylamino)uracil reductase